MSKARKDLKVYKPYKIAIDIDDTLLSTKELEEYYWKIFLQNNPDILPDKEYHWGDIEREKFWNEYREKMAFGKIKEGAIECLDILVKKGYIVDLLTARSADRYAPLKKRFAKYLKDNYLHYYNIYYGYHSKVEFLKEHNYNILIDNDIRHIEQANSIGITTILFGTNINYSGYQASNWGEVHDIIDEIMINNSK